MTDLPTTIPGASAMTARITGIAAIIAPILLLASTLAYVLDGNGINDGHLGGTIGVWSCLALLLAMIGIYRVLEPATPRGGPIMLTVVVIGVAAGVGFNVDGILAAEFGQGALDIFPEETPIALLAFLPWGWFLPIGMVGTGILMWRTRTFPKATAVLVALGGIVFVTSRPARIDALAVFGDCLLILGLAPIGWALLTGRSDVGHQGPTSEHPQPNEFASSRATSDLPEN